MTQLNKHDIYKVSIAQFIEFDRKIKQLYAKSKSLNSSQQRRTVLEDLRQWITRTLPRGYSNTVADQIADRFEYSLQTGIQMQRVGYYFWTAVGSLIMPLIMVYLMMVYMPHHHPNVIRFEGGWIGFTYLCSVLFSFMVAQPAAAWCTHKSEVYSLMVKSLNGFRHEAMIQSHNDRASN